MPTPTPRPLRLMQQVPNKVYNRLVVRDAFQTDRHFAAAFHFSAQRLADTFSGQPIDDLILLPFLTLYRQAFELELKNTIRGLVRLRIQYIDGSTKELREAVSEEQFRSEFGHNLHKLLNEAQKHYSALNLPEPFPKGAASLILMLHEADKSGTAFRYAGSLPEVEDRADFPDLAALFDYQFGALSVVEVYAEELYSAGPTLSDLIGDSY